MKRILLILMFVVLVLNNMALAESLHPNEVVKLFINALRQDDLEKISETANLQKIASHPRHSMTLEQLKEFFEDVELSRVKFQEIKHESWSENIIARIVEPISYDFDLELQKATLEKQESYYMITSVHP